MSLKRPAESSEISPDMGKRMRIPTAKLRAAEAEKPPQKSKKPSAPSARREPRISNGLDSLEEPAVPAEKSSASDKASGSHQAPTQPSRRTSVCDIADEDDWSETDEIIEVDVHGNTKKVTRNPNQEGPEEELGK